MRLVTGIVTSLLVACATALYDSTDDVIPLTDNNFNSEVLQSDELWLVEFFAEWCGHCKALAPEYKKVAKSLKGLVKVGAVDMDKYQSVGQPYGIQGFPTIKVFGLNKNKPTDYNGPRTAKGIIDHALAMAKSIVDERFTGKKSTHGGGQRKVPTGNAEDVMELTDNNFGTEVLESEEMWMVEFFAPWCGHCKRLEPEWRAAATELKGKIRFGALDATAHTSMASRYGVKGYPTIKMFPAGHKDGEAIDFDGGRTASDIVNWAKDKLAENVPPPEVYQLLDQDALNDACNDHQLCIIAVLPHILDCQSQCRNDYLDILRKLGNKYKKRMWGWVWAEAGAQPEVEQAFGIGGFGYPAMAALNARKMKFSLLKGSFGETGINEFLRELAVGRGRTESIRGNILPTVKTQEAWDGKDGVLPQEDDIDLSDVVLDDLDSDKDKKKKEEL